MQPYCAQPINTDYARRHTSGCGLPNSPNFRTITHTGLTPHLFAHSRCFHLRTRSTIMILYAKTDRLSNMQRLNQILRLTRRTVLRQKAQLYKLRCVCRTDRDAQAAHDKADNPLYQFLYNWYLFHCQRYACAYKHNHSCINKVGYVILHKGK